MFVCVLFELFQFFDYIYNYSLKFYIPGLIQVILTGEHFHRSVYLLKEAYRLSLSYCLCFCDVAKTCEHISLVVCWI